MLGRRLKGLRIEKGSTLSAVAKEIGISAAALSKYENDLQIPGDLYLSRIADYYGLTMKELLSEDNGDMSLPENPTKKLCPWRIRKGVDERSGDTMTWFMSCMGHHCMAYENGICKRLPVIKVDSEKNTHGR